MTKVRQVHPATMHQPKHASPTVCSLVGASTNQCNVGAQKEENMSLPLPGCSLEPSSHPTLYHLERKSKSHSVMSDSLRPHRLYSLWYFPGQNARVGSLSFLQGIFPGMEPRSLELQADSLPAEPQGKPKNIGVGSLSLLQGIFPTQDTP